MITISLNVFRGTIQDLKYMLEPVRRDNSPALAQRIYDFFDKITQSSFEAWERSGKNERF